FAAGLDYLERSHQACVDRGIAYLVVNIPDHAERYAGPSTDSPYGKYLKILGDFCHERQIPFVDMTDGDPRKYNSDSDFADFDHLNRRGAAEFSAELGRRVAPLLAAPKHSKVAAK